MGERVKELQKIMELAPNVSEKRAQLLRDLARRHKLRWEVWPERQVFDGVIKQIGFDLDLAGQAEGPRTRRALTRRECAKVARALKVIALFILPKPGRASRYDVEHFDGAVRYPNDPRAPGYVKLTIRILHRSGYEDPPDDCESRCLTEMEAKLRALGAKAKVRHLGQAVASGTDTGRVRKQE